MLLARLNGLVDEERLTRYADKLRHVEDRLGDFKRWSPLASDDDMAKAASFKALQEIGEGIADVCAMLTKDLERSPKDDYTNAAELHDAGVFTEDLRSAIEELNGLRNRLVHEYDRFDDEQALESGRRLADTIPDVVGALRRWISENA